jgi:hypothetical protein
VSFFKTDDGTAIYKKLGASGEELDSLVERLSVRLGRGHEVVVAFKEGDEAVLAIWRAAGLLRLEPESDGSGSATRQIRQLNDQKRVEIEQQRMAFDAGREKFIVAAHRAAGLELD